MMSLKISLLALVAAAIACLSFGVSAAPEGCTNNYKVQYLDLSLSWAPGACSSVKIQCKKGVPSAFTIHGLWPQSGPYEYPQNCCTRKRFDAIQIYDLRAQMKASWPTLVNMENERFWSHEWNKHGSCAAKINGLDTVPDYFRFALNKFKQVNLEQVLTNAGYYPTNQNYYSGQGIISALSSVYKRKVSIECGPKRGDAGTLVLTDVHLCFDPKTLNQIDCPASNRKCLQQIKFLKLVQ